MKEFLKKRDEKCAVGRSHMLSETSLCILCVSRDSVAVNPETARHRDTHHGDTEHAQRRTRAGGFDMKIMQTVYAQIAIRCLVFLTCAAILLPANPQVLARAAHR